MDKQVFEKINILRREIHEILANQLSYPKTIISLAEERNLSESERFKAQYCIDRAIALVDLQFHLILNSE